MNETLTLPEKLSIAKGGTVRLTTAQALVRYLSGLRAPVEGPQQRNRSAFWRSLRDLRPRKRRGPRGGAVSVSRPVTYLSGAQRTGHGPRSNRVLEGAFPATDDGVHDFHRPRGDEPSHGGCTCSR